MYVIYLMHFISPPPPHQPSKEIIISATSAEQQLWVLNRHVRIHTSKYVIIIVDIWTDTSLLVYLVSWEHVEQRTPATQPYSKTVGCMSLRKWFDNIIIIVVNFGSLPRIMWFLRLLQYIQYHAIIIGISYYYAILVQNGGK